MTTEQILNLDPDDILIRDNVRFNLKPYRVDSLAESITQAGGVRQPVGIEKLDEPVDGKEYALQFGAYRHAAVAKLNREQNAGLALPCRVVPALSDAERLLAQVSENNERENMSPMDKAIAINKMLAAGISRLDIRKAFSTPGGRKGVKMAPASNSHINMLASFINFPKTIQNKLHDGTLGIGAAYQLTKLDKEKWEPILEKAEADRIKAIEVDEKEETAYLEASKKAETEAQEKEKIEKEFNEARDLAEKTAQLIKEKAAEVTEALTVQVAAKGKDREEATKVFKSAQAELKAAQDVAEKARKEFEKLEGKAKTQSEKADAAKKRLEEARSVKAAKDATKTPKVAGKVTGADVQKAAKATGASTKAVKLNANDMREAVKSITILSGTKYPKTAMVGVVLLKCFDGEITDGQLQVAIARITGEEKTPEAVPAPKGKK